VPTRLPVVLTLMRLGRGREEYHLRAVEADASGRGEVAGRWLGGGARDLGLWGRVRDRDLLAVLAGYAPGAQPDGEGMWLGTRLVAFPRARQRTPGFDACFSVPKGVSLLWAFGDRLHVEGRRLDRVVELAHDEAVRAAVGYLEQVAARGRRGPNGLTHVRSSGFVAAVFRQRTSRANDPHLHSHVLVANLCRGEDGRWGALDSRLLYAHVMAAGYLYECHLRYRLGWGLGVEWSEVVHGTADVVGVPVAMLERFSKRAREISGHLEAVAKRINRERRQLGLEPVTIGSPAALEVAAHRTRAAKLAHLATSELRASWRAEAVAAGLDPDRLADVLHRARRAPSTAHDPDLDRRVVARLTEHASTFGEREVVQALAAEARSGLPVAEVLRRARALLASEAVVSVAGALRGQGVIRRADGRTAPVPTGERRWSTPELLALEARLVEEALRRREEGVAVVPEAALREGRRRLSDLGPDQVELAARLARSGAGVECVEARPRTGTTAALGLYVAACRRAGIPVVGGAPRPQARARLHRGAGIVRCLPLDQLLLDLAHEPLPRGGVVILDEAGVVGSRKLAQLLGAASAHGAKVVLVGDPASLSSVDAGGGFRGLVACLGAHRLGEGRRPQGGEPAAGPSAASAWLQRGLGRPWPRGVASSPLAGPVGGGRGWPSPGPPSAVSRGGRRRRRREWARRSPATDGQGRDPAVTRTASGLGGVIDRGALRASPRD
jgi:conjugative relaxase-like TrwC/TraI family protein